MRQYTKGVMNFKGVDSSKEPHLIDSSRWFMMEQMRARFGDVSIFPGYTSIPLSAAYTEPCTLLTEFRKQDGTIFVVFADINKVYKLDVNSGTMTDITGAAVLTVTGEFPWTSIVWLDTLYISCKVEGPYKWTGAGNIAVLGGTPPLFWHVNVLKDHLCGLGVGAIPQRFQWAAEGTDNTWTGTTTNDAGSFDLIDSPDWATGLHQLGDDLIAYFENRIVPISWIGGNEVFSRRRAVTDTGLVGHYAVAQFSDAHFGMGKDFFWKYTGGAYVDDSIGDAIRERVYASFQQNMRRYVRTLVKRSTYEILWAYPDGGATVGANRCVIFNYKENEWYGPFDFNIDMFMETIKTVSFTSINSDLRIIDTVISVINAGTPAGAGLNHYFATPDGGGEISIISEDTSDNDTEVAFRKLQSGDHFLGDGATTESGAPTSFPFGTVFQVTGMRFETKDSGFTDDQITEFYIGSRMELNDDIIWAGPYNITGNSSQVIKIPLRKSGRWFRVRFQPQNNASFILHGYQYIFTTMGVR